MQNIKDLCAKHSILSGLIGMITVFFLIFSVSTLVDVFNKIKEGKYIGQEVESKNTLVVSGKGEAYIKPDLALTSFSVVTEKKTVASAMTENTKKMNAIIKAIKEMDVEDKDLKTTNFSVSPRYDYDNGVYSSKRTLAGYEVSQSLEVKIRDLEKIGEIIQKATDNGANQIGDLQFTIDDIEEAKKEVRKDAIADAREKAETIAKQLGVDLVRVINFSENISSPYYYANDSSRKEMSAAGASEESASIQTGENKVEINVSVTYEIN